MDKGSTITMIAYFKALQTNDNFIKHIREKINSTLGKAMIQLFHIVSSGKIGLDVHLGLKLPS